MALLQPTNFCLSYKCDAGQPVFPATQEVVGVEVVADITCLKLSGAAAE